ncbi:MAG: hypothetical protein V3V01_01575 [Acidimicrobiales bacterium]
MSVSDDGLTALGILRTVVATTTVLIGVAVAFVGDAWILGEGSISFATLESDDTDE